MRARGERGQATVLAAISMPIFCGFLGLAIDVGSFYSVKRQVQVAADAAAKAAALELKRGRPGLVPAVAASAAADNGFATGLTVNHPPQSGPHTGDAAYVEAIVSRSAPTMMLRFVVSSAAADVRGRAVAGLVGGEPPAGVFVLNRNRSEALKVFGGSTLTSELDVWVSSTSGNAVSVTSGSCLSAPNIGVTGGYEGSCFSGGTPLTGMIPDDDPLASLAAPDAGGPCDFTDVELKNESATLVPGVYCGGIDISNNADVTLQPGIYILRGGGLEVSHHAVLQGTGVMFYNTGDATHPAGNIIIDSNASVSLSAPASGPHAGLIVFFDRALPAQSLEMEIKSSADTWLEGTLYVLNQQIRVHSGTKSNNAAPWMIMVSDTLEVTNGSDLVVPAKFSQSLVPSPIRSATWVE